jgi:CubicO group peptidase (beta-lactamase class C family)
MPRLITRRTLLTNGLKSGLGLAVLQTVKGAPSFLIAETGGPQADRFGPAYQRLDQFIARHLNETGAPGMTVAIADRKGLLRTSQYGFADVKTGLRPTPQTLFEIGSISKSFVAMATLQLVEEGKLDLHKPVRDYLPWVKLESNYAPLTAHHLLSHTSGLSGVPLLMRVAATTLRTGFEPGVRFVYSNIGYVLLGLLLETLDRRALSEVLRQRVLGPLGMSGSEPIITNNIRARVAIGYSPLYPDRPFSLKGKLVEAPWLEVPEAAGSIAATATDMAGYLRMLLNRGVGPNARVLSEKSFELFTTPVIKAPFRSEDASYAYGLWVSDTKGHTLLRHTGGMVAFSSAMYADVTDGFAVFASVNARLGGYRPVEVTQYALNLLSAAAGGHELPALPPSPPAPDRIKNAADYAGSYTAPDGTKLVLAGEGEQLMLVHNGQRVVLEQAARDRFIVKHPEFELFLLGFSRDKDVVVEAFHGSRWWVNEHYAGPKTFDYPKEWDALTGHYRSDSPWYGSTRLVIRKGGLLLDGERPLPQIEPGVFRPLGDSPADWVTFDTIVNGRATHLNYSGIDFYRTFTP